MHAIMMNMDKAKMSLMPNAAQRLISGLCLAFSCCRSHATKFLKNNEPHELMSLIKSYHSFSAICILLKRQKVYFILLFQLTD